MKKLLQRLFRKKKTYAQREFLIDNIAFGIFR